MVLYEGQDESVRGSVRKAKTNKFDSLRIVSKQKLKKYNESTFKFANDFYKNRILPLQ